MKRIVSLLLVAAMIVGFAPMIKLQSYAEETAQVIESVELTCPEITVGTPISQLVLTAPEGAAYRVEGQRFQDYDTGENVTSEVVEDGKNYFLGFELLPAEGYYFSQNCKVSLNGNLVSFDVGEKGDNLQGWAIFSFAVTTIEIWGLHSEIYPGEAELPELMVEGEGEDRNQVEILEYWWEDTSGNKVTTFENSKVYYLAVKIKAVGERTFGREDIRVENGGELEILSATEAVVRYRYSLEPDVGNIGITVNGLQAGKKAEDLEVTVSGNAVLDYVQVVNVENEEVVLEGALEEDLVYRIDVWLKPKENYRFTGAGDILVNGQEPYHYEWEDDFMCVNFVHTDCEVIELVELTAPEAEVDKDIADLIPQAPAGANYDIEYEWLDVTDPDEYIPASGKLQQRHRYQLRISVLPKTGYILSETPKVMLNDERQECGVYSYGKEGVVNAEYSFLEKITKIQLPAVPKNLTTGQTLPADLAVADSENFTADFVWYYYSYTEGIQEASKVEQKGVYELDVNIWAKPGYEFAKDVQVYFGDQLHIDNSHTGDSDYYYAVKYYNVGMPEIKKVELTVSGLKPGMIPTDQSVVVPSGAKYAVMETAWVQGETEDVFAGDTVEQLQSDLYTFVGIILMTYEGSVFGSEATFYLNGKKVDLAYQENGFYYTIVYLSLGKLSNQAVKLETPKLTKEGTTLKWNAVADAMGYEIYRATSKNGKYALVTTVTETAFLDTVAAGKTYYYKVKAVAGDPSCNSDLSSYISVAFKCPEPVISAAISSSGKPKLTWEQVDGAKKYTVYRATSENGKYSKLGAATKPEYIDNKASVGKTYYYKVVANGTSSTYTSGFSNAASCSVICGTPSVTVKIDATTGRPTLSWGKISKVYKYVISRKLPGEEDFTVLATQTATTYVDKTAPMDTECQYIVQAVHQTAAFNGVPAELTVATGIARPSLKGSVNSDGRPSLSWNPIEGAVKYEIYRSTKTASGYELIATVEEATYIDSTAVVGKSYYYKAVALGQVGRSADSSYVKLACKCAAPEITVEADDLGRPCITWEKVEGALKYTIYRATSENGKYSKLGTSKTESYTDTKTKPGNVYFYKVIANPTSGSYNSPYSNAASCTVYCATPVVTVTNNASGAPVISWNKVTGAVKYKVMYMDATDYLGSAFGPYADFEEHHTAVYTTKTSFTIPNTEAGRFYMVVVIAVAKNESYSSEGSEEVFADAVPAAPKVTGKVGANNKPLLSWKEVEGAVTYEIYRSTSKSKGYTLLDETEDLSFEDLTAVKGKTYYYKVVAVRYNLRSAESAPVKVKSK